MGALIARRVFAATAPSATIALGAITWICRMRNGEQVSHSSRSGVRLPGGRHLMMFAMYTSSRTSSSAGRRAIARLSEMNAKPVRDVHIFATQAHGLDHVGQ